MNYVDLFLVLVIVLSVASGLRRGFISGMLELVAWIGSVVLAFLAYPYIGKFLEKHISSLGFWAMPLAFLIVFIIIRVIFSMIAYRVLDALPPGTHQHTINKVFGIIPGAINGVIWAALIAVLVLMLPVSETLTQQVQDSKLAVRLTDRMQWAEEKIAPVFDNAIDRGLTKLTIEPGSEKFIKLPYTVVAPRTRPDLEAAMLKLVNEERTKTGLRPVKADSQMTDVARKHSLDMFRRGYFSHITPEHKDPFDRMKADKVRFLTAGENLAMAPTLSSGHTGLMNSPGHRANILQPSFGRLGIGIMDGGIRGLMITQNFRN